ncbi:Uncharacterized protein ACO02O_04829 [Dirofilaria immitis]
MLNVKNEINIVSKIINNSEFWQENIRKSFKEISNDSDDGICCNIITRCHSMQKFVSTDEEYHKSQQEDNGLNFLFTRS